MYRFYVQFTKDFLYSLPDFLQAEPMRYLWAGVLACLVVKFIFKLIGR